MRDGPTRPAFCGPSAGRAYAGRAYAGRASLYCHP